MTRRTPTATDTDAGKAAHIPPGRRRRHPWLAGAATILLAAGVAACGSSTPPTAAAGSGAGASAAGGSSAGGAVKGASKHDTTGSGGVTLRVGDQAGTGAEALLSAAGLLHKLPFTVSWSDFTSGPPMLQAMSAGALDVGGVGDAPPVFAAAGGANIAIVGATATGPANAALIVPKNSPIHSISQLKGKKIAVAQGSSADYHLLTVLNKAGLSTHDVSLSYLQPAEGLAALSSGQVDAWDIWAPFIEQAVLQHGDRIIANGQGYGSNYSYVVASKSAIADRTKAKEITEYIAAVAQAHRWADSHPAAWGATWAKATGLPSSVMTVAAKDAAATPVPVNATITTQEQSVVDAFAKAGLIPSQYSIQKFINPGFNGSLGG